MKMILPATVYAVALVWDNEEGKQYVAAWTVVVSGVKPLTDAEATARAWE